MLRRFVVDILIIIIIIIYIYIYLWLLFSQRMCLLARPQNEAKVPTAKDVLGAWDYAVADPQGRYRV